MSLLQPWVLLALPLLALPVLIHLIHRRRHRVVEWGAMMFLLEGSRLSRGRQRLREILLLIARTLAIAGVLFALGRPIAGGWVGQLAGESIDTVVLIVDRSASMGESVANRAESKLAFGLRQITRALEIARPGELVVIDGVSPSNPVRVDGPSALAELTMGAATESASDIVAAFETAATYLTESVAGRAEIWVLSDAQTGDWQPDDGRWAALSETLANAPAGVRVRLTADLSVAPDNYAVRVERARRQIDGDEAELVLDIVVTRAEVSAASGDTALLVPVAIEVGGARSSVEIELIGNEARLQGHRVPIDARLETGFGRVELVADARPGDDTYWFVFGGSSSLETLVVAERGDVASIVSTAAATPLDPAWRYEARDVEADAAGDLDLTGVSLLVWQAALPGGAQKDALEDFVRSGGVALFLPPQNPRGGTFAGLGWGEWRVSGAAGDDVFPSIWRSDDDLLRAGADGTPLPVGEVELRSTCAIEERGETAHARISLASLPDGGALLVRSSTVRGGVYFFGALPTPDSTNLASQGIVLMALVHRALGSVAGERGSGIQRDAGASQDWMADEWYGVEGVDTDRPLFERDLYAGVLTDGEAFVALNRPVSEDGSTPQPLSALRELFGSVEVVTTSASEAGTESGLVEEIWRLFLTLCLIALVGESLLCWGEGTPKRQGDQP